MNRIDFIKALEERNFKKESENCLIKLDKVIIKIYSDQDVKVVIKDTSKIFAFMDVYERVIEYVDSVED